MKMSFYFANQQIYLLFFCETESPLKLFQITMKLRNFSVAFYFYSLKKPISFVYKIIPLLPFCSDLKPSSLNPEPFYHDPCHEDHRYTKPTPKKPTMVTVTVTVKDDEGPVSGVLV